ncbi:DUF4124 domain-containing protein [Arenimonas oryziterrae]|uniref:DUF4124 domain-containing protein n=1 Tax=Arenimonas oryziterrae DSM 21050 = YC6267 TaxID=1121015 RepID=A0A091BGR3_9GAMM|nr:DUF4124 domain-containing protein [Arenimonas oryziterrae]KFN43550.1 hypothetical protein N789_09755 [Arenimonas oryziterrae DSM 21050 = YC6267]
MKRAASLTAACLLLLVPVHGQEARAQGGIHRCVGADGRSIFTDRRCEDMQGTEQVTAPAGAVGASAHVAVRSCARTRDDLLFGVRSALESQDVNRFAAYYHWTGMGTTEAYRLMDRLSVFSERPLVDAQLVSSMDFRDQEAPAAPAEFVDGPTSAELSLGLEAPPAPPPPGPPAPDLIRVDQMSSRSDAGSQTTYFHLQANAGCWWIRY